MNLLGYRGNYFNHTSSQKQPKKWQGHFLYLIGPIVSVQPVYYQSTLSTLSTLFETHDQHEYALDIESD